MEFSVLAYQVGGVFLLAALVMYGTLVRGFIPDVFRNAKPVAIAFGLVVLALAVYQWYPGAYSRASSALTFDSAAPRTSALPASVESAAEPAYVPKRITKPARRAARVEIPKPPVVAPVPATSPPPETEPAVAEASPPETPLVAAAEVSPPAPAATAPPPPAPDPSVPESANRENPAKRVVKSIGHFLHIGRKKH
jgi:hypothetical protein